MGFKILNIIFIIIFLNFMLMSCSSSKNLKTFWEKEEVVIDFWTMDMKTRFEKYIRYIIEKFENDHGNIKIVWNDFPHNEIVIKLYDSWKNGTLPDVITLDTKTLINKINSELLVNLKDYEEEFPYEFFEGLLSSTQKDGKQLGFPWYTDIKVLFINKEIMDNAGIFEENYPKNEEEFINSLKIIQSNSGKFGSVLEPDNIESLIFNGLNIFGEDSKIKIDKEEIENYFKTNQMLFNENVVPKDFFNFGDKIYLYANKEVAMIKSSFQFISNIEKISREVYENTIIYPLPLGKNNLRYSETMNLSIINDNENIEEAIEFMSFILNEDNQIEFANNFNLLPTNKSFIDSDIFVDDNLKVQEAQTIAFRSLVDSRDFVFNMENYDQISGIIEKYSRMIYLDCVDVKSYLQNAQLEIENLNNQS